MANWQHYMFAFGAGVLFTYAGYQLGRYHMILHCIELLP